MSNGSTHIQAHCSFSCLLMQAATLSPLQTPVGHDAAPVTAEQPNHQKGRTKLYKIPSVARINFWES